MIGESTAVHCARSLFRFDSNRHEYIELMTGDVRPHITGMLEQTGWSDSTWFTEESRIRGSAVHRLTADYDLEALVDVASCTSAYKPYLQAHVEAMRVIRPKWVDVELPLYHGLFRYGGRPDRAGLVYQLMAVLEVKSGAPERCHPIQTALQAILAAQGRALPADAWGRFALYLKPSGRWSLEEHKNPRDFTEARRIIRACC